MFAGTLALGFDNGRFFSGGAFDVSSTNHNQNGGAVFDTRGRFQIFIGYRFNAPEVLNNRFELIRKRLSFK